jgi:hypothetical protein
VNPAYYDTQFRGSIVPEKLPSPCYIITACNPMDEPLSDAENKRRNEGLKQNIKNGGHLCIEVIGGSKDWPHQEPSFLTSAPQTEVIQWAKHLNQQAIFEISKDTLYLLSTEHPEQKVRLGSFKERIR